MHTCTGDDTYGRKVIVFSACNMPPREDLDHKKLLRCDISVETHSCVLLLSTIFWFNMFPGVDLHGGGLLLLFLLLLLLLLLPAVWLLLWPPCVADADTIFLSCAFYLSIFFVLA